MRQVRMTKRLRCYWSSPDVESVRVGGRIARGGGLRINDVPAQAGSDGRVLSERHTERTGRRIGDVGAYVEVCAIRERTVAILRLRPMAESDHLRYRHGGCVHRGLCVLWRTPGRELRAGIGARRICLGDVRY